MENVTITKLNIESAETRVRGLLENFSKNIAIVESDIGHQNIVFNNLTEDVYVMNVTAKIIWHSLKKDAGVQDIVQALKNWFTAGINEEEVVEDLDSYLHTLLNEGLIYDGESDKGGFPVGRVINITQNQKNISYEAPILNKYNREILKEKHPAIFYATQFSDTWGPATNGGK